MNVLLQIGYIVGSLGLGIYAYIWVSTFKEISEFTDEDWNKTIEEVNESGKGVEGLSKSQKATMRFVNKGIFLVFGCLIWTLTAVTMGKIASDITMHPIWKWFVHLGMYFLLLRIPFGVANRIVKSFNPSKKFPEEVLFVIFMIAFYILSIYYYEALPSFLKWHLVFLS